MTEKYVRLSDVEDVLEKAGLVTKYYDDGYESISGYDAYNVDEGLSKIPTADVEPVRHAHWILQDDNKHSCCSNCKAKRNISTQIGWKYCPICGARMD